MNRVQLKTIAKQQLQGNIGMLFVFTYYMGIIKQCSRSCQSHCSATFNAWNKHDFSWFDA